ncbi:MAG: ATP-dependent Clp protease adapter ClpS [Alphaproteobacteria bacterium]|nr:ATP-dependent Clp protease adapter ClpS [Alphaproteobacteria bacterium]
MTLDTEKTTLHITANGNDSDGGDYGDQQGQEGGLLLAERQVKTQRPPFFKVVLLNDDYTPMEFVVLVLKDVFRKPHEEAISTMLEIHHSGAGIGGVYTRDVAETKAELALTLARRAEYPLQCRVEKE